MASSVCFKGLCVLVFFFKQKTAYEVRISDWSSDVCPSDLADPPRPSAAYRPRKSAGSKPSHRARRTPHGCSHRAGRREGTASDVRGGPSGPCPARRQLGRASWRDRECQSVLISVVAVSVKKKTTSVSSSICKLYGPP